MIDLKNLNRYKENNRIEAKLAAGGLPKSIWETYSAFANTVGGIILLGVEERRDKSLHITGIENPEEQVREFREIVKNPKKVSADILTPEDVEIQTVRGKKIIVIKVPRADRHSRPVYLGESPYGGSYRRNGEGDYHCSNGEVRTMLRDRGDISGDLAVLEPVTADALDKSTVARYRLRFAGIHPEHEWNILPDLEFLKKIGAVDRSSLNRKIHPTSGGLLMFGRKEEIAGEFPGCSLTYRERENSREEWRPGPKESRFEGNLFDFYFFAYGRIAADLRKRVGYDERVSRANEKGSIYEALREALANAIIHADYYGDSSIVVEKENTSIRIENPGGLRISIDKAASGEVSDPRNELLIRMFSFVNIGKNTGGGFRNIRRIFTCHGFEEPRLTEHFNPDSTSLLLEICQKTSPPKEAAGSTANDVMKEAKSQEQKSGDEDKLKLILWLTDKVEGTKEEIGTLLEKPQQVTEQYLTELMEEELIVKRRTRTGLIKYSLKA